MTAPYLARAAVDVGAGYRPVLTARTRRFGSSPSPLDLDVLSAQLVEDESRTPRIEVTMTVVWTSALSALDLRAGVWLDLSVGYRYLDGVVDVPANGWQHLVVRDLAPIPGTGTGELRAVGLECLLDPELFTFDGINGVLAGPAGYLATYTFPAIDPAGSIPRTIDSTGMTSGSLSLTADEFAGMTYADMVGTACEATGNEWWVTREGVWRFKARSTAAPTVSQSVATFRPGAADSTVTEYRPQSSLDGMDYANHVVIEWPDGKTTSSVPPTAPTRPIVTARIRRRVDVATASVRGLVTTAIANRLRSYGTGQELTASWHLWVRAGDVVTITPAGEAATYRLVRRVAFRYPAGDMTLATRNPAATA